MCNITCFSPALLSPATSNWYIEIVLFALFFEARFLCVVALAQEIRLPSTTNPSAGTEWSPKPRLPAPNFVGFFFLPPWKKMLFLILRSRGWPSFPPGQSGLRRNWSRSASLERIHCAPQSQTRVPPRLWGAVSGNRYLKQGDPVARCNSAITY